MGQLRLLKINVQPVFVIDDGKFLEEKSGQILTVSPGKWEGFAAGFLNDIDRLRSDYVEDDSVAG